jgi:hypothetical protein
LLLEVEKKNTRDNEFFGFFYDGLQNMPQALNSLLNNKTYKEILLASGGVQVVFLSFLCCPFLSTLSSRFQNCSIHFRSALSSFARSYNIAQIFVLCIMNFLQCGHWLIVSKTVIKASGCEEVWDG